jgi:hypothetical protein
MKLSLRLFSEIRLLRLHNVMKRILKIRFSIIFRTKIKAGRKVIFDLFPVRGMQTRVTKKKEKGREPCGAAEFNILQLQ